MFSKRAQIPIEQRNYGTYYAVFAGLLFVGTLWAVVDEVVTRRPWKEEQREYQHLAAQRYRDQLKQANADFDSSSYMEQTALLQAARDSMNSPRYLSLMKQYDDVLEQLNDATRDFQFAKSRDDEAYYFYKRSLHEGQADPGDKAKIEKNEAEMARKQSLINTFQAQRDTIFAQINVYRLALKQHQNAIADLRKNVDKWEKKIERLDAAPVEIKQVMRIDYDKNPFNDAKARIDRCQTCHQGWNDDVMEGAPQPFARHPLPELLALHNPESFGCTPCHRGQGPALTASMAHGDGDQYWENPLLRGKEVYASCNACHGNESDLKYAPEFTKSKRTMIESGCFGCHEIKGYTDLPKIGPELARVGWKTTPEWIFRWVKNPKDYNPHTRMPNFLFTDDQAAAVTAYLVDLSSKNPFPLPKGAFAGGDPARGKAVFESAGCRACHVLGEETEVRSARGTSYDIAPELTRVGSKVTPDWIYDWVRNPRHYNPTTKMPNLRLTDGEAKDITSFLATQRDTRALPPVSVDVHSPDLIRRGESIVREYGCFGCHTIPGMEKESRVSVDLSNFGRKRVEEMDFGDTHVSHTWHDWVQNKLHNSRVFQTDRIVQKMPVFAFNESEISSLTIFLLSQTKDKPGDQFVRPFDRRLRNIEAGRRVTYAYNCRQCHQLEDTGGFIDTLITETAMIPPIITGEGKKVQEPWLHDFLSSPSTVGQPNAIRPWIKTRMPTFGFADEDISKVTKYFLGLSDQELELRDYRAYRPDPELLPIGGKIFSDFQCMKCHPTGAAIPKPGEASTADLAPNLTKARDRLKPEWIVEWLNDPNKLQPGTRMPTFFPDGQSPLPDVLGGDAHRQEMAIRDYVISIGRPPRAVVTAR